MNKEELARSKYHGAEHYNCAQAVLAAFIEESGLTPADLAKYSSCGGGRAEGGVCGALYAAESLLKDTPAIEELRSEFTSSAGSLKCREIRKENRLPCNDCVGLAARVVAEHLSQPRP